MSRHSEFDRPLLFVAASGVVILLSNIYYFCHPLFSGSLPFLGFLDYIFIRLHSSGVFSNPFLTKALPVVLCGPVVAVKRGESLDLGWRTIIAGALLSVPMYFVPISAGQVLYGAFTLAGFSLMMVCISAASRKMEPFDGEQLQRMESFAQCSERICTSDSVNIPTSYLYRGRWRRGWINVVNPYRATLVLGTPGAGKSFSVYNPFIEQMVSKGYSMFVYDYKFPDLTSKVYSEYSSLGKSQREKYRFCVINFKDPERSYRCNPIHPRFMTDPIDSTEIADLVMKNVNRGSTGGDNFFSQSGKLYLDAVIWFLRIYNDGEFCTFPHVIEFMTKDYNKVLKILLSVPELEAKVMPFVNALEGGANDQIQGQIASAQIPLAKFASKSLYWVLSGDDISLDLNSPDEPKILCVGNDPDRQEIYSTTLALFTSRMFKQINHKGKLPCGVLLDELPTIYLKGLDQLIATARSNRVAIVMGVQDKSQLIRDYGEKEAEVIFNTVGNIFCGQVNGRTAVEMSRTLGSRMNQRRSRTVSEDSHSQTISLQKEEILPVSTIETLSRGSFFGKVADGNVKYPIDEKFFFGKILAGSSAGADNGGELPVLTRFDNSGENGNCLSGSVDWQIEENFERIKRDVNMIIEACYKG